MVQEQAPGGLFLGNQWSKSRHKWSNRKAILNGRIAITYSLDTFYIKEEGWKDAPNDGVHSFKLDKTAMVFLLYQEENQVIMIAKGWFIRFWDDIPNKNIERIIIRGKDREGKNDINIVDFISNGQLYFCLNLVL